MTPPAVLDRTDAPDTTEAPATATTGAFLYRTGHGATATPRVPNRQEVLRAMYDEGLTHDKAASIYDMFGKLAEALAHLESGEITAEEITQRRGRIIGSNETYPVYTLLFPNDPRHTALARIMNDNVLSEDGTEAHRLLERHFLPDGQHRFVHSFINECVAGITRR
jgi:hypothetical protein